MAGENGLGQSSSGHHPHERRPQARRGGRAEQSAWCRQSLRRGQFRVSYLRFVQSHHEPAGADTASGRPAEKGDGMKRRVMLGGLAALAAAAAGGAAWMLHPFARRYAPTPYDDLLNQIVD